MRLVLVGLVEDFSPTGSSQSTRMPKSKRNKVTTLSKTSKKVGLEFKQALIDKVRASVDDHTHLLVFAVRNMRNTHLQVLSISH